MPLLVLVILALVASPAGAQLALDVPRATGDQLVFFFDARTNRVPFLTIANPAEAPVTVEIAFHSQALSARLGESTRTIAGQGNIVVNPIEEAGGVANGTFGLAVVTPVLGERDPRPVVPPEPLMGGYTIANTALGAGFGDNPMARLAVTGAGQRAAPGSEVDGTSVRYQRFAPDVLMIPTFYNPDSLDPPESDGNRVILAAFRDRYADRFDVGPHSVTARATVMKTDGAIVAQRDVSIVGVLSSDVESVAGDAKLDSSGKVFFAMDVGEGNVFGIFSQSLAAFGAGARMAAVAQGPDPGGTPRPVATPTPAATAVPTPTPGGAAVCGNGVAEGFEECDGADLDDSTCADTIGGLSRCTGLLACKSDCTFEYAGCNCNCQGDFDCDLEIDCNSFVEFCELDGACQNNRCVTNPVGTALICNGVDPDPDFADDPYLRCEPF